MFLFFIIVDDQAITNTFVCSKQTVSPGNSILLFRN